MSKSYLLRLITGMERGNHGLKDEYDNFSVMTNFA